MTEPFEEKYIPEPMSGCWIWLRSVRTDGYGNVKFRGRADRAHRVSYTLNKGEIPKGKFVLHKCDNRLCVNPDHLYLGHYLENAADRKRRKGYSDQSCENNNCAKIRHSDVVEMLSSPDTNAEIARRFGIGAGHVWRIRAGKTNWTKGVSK